MSEPAKKKNKKVWIYDLLIVVLVGVIVYFGYQFYSEQSILRESSQTYDSVVSGVLTVGDEIVTATVNGKEFFLPRYKIDFDKLLEQNPDTVAWLFCDDSVINYPVVQTTDNDYYLHHLFNGEVNACGTLFIDYQNEPDFSDQNTIIYGHFMRNKQMFYSLKYYEEQEYYEEHPIMMLYTPAGDYLIEIFASSIMDGTKGFTMSFESEEDYQAWIDRVYAESDIVSDVEMTTEDRMVTLYTCAYTFRNAKRLLFGKLIPLED